MTLNSKSIGNKIAAGRKSINLSQADLAEQVSISSQAVGKWERGESLPDIRTLNRLAEIFGVDLNYFADNAPSISNNPIIFDVVDQENQETPAFKPKKKIGLNWDMSSAEWIGADFSGLNNLKDKFSSANIKNCKFISSDLSDLILKGNNIVDNDFSNSDLRNSKIQSSYLSKNDFKECTFIDAEFSETELINCTFSKANFSGAEFSSVDFAKNKVDDALWKLTSFNLSHISNIVFNGLIEECSFDNCSFSKVTFENCKLENTFFKGKKLKGINFINCESDRISYEFLKNGKADINGITVLED